MLVRFTAQPTVAFRIHNEIKICTVGINNSRIQYSYNTDTETKKN